MNEQDEGGGVVMFIPVRQNQAIALKEPTKGCHAYDHTT